MTAILRYYKVQLITGGILAVLFALALNGGSTPEQAFQGVGTLGLLAVLYMLPTIIAYQRHHNNKLAITMLNVLLGWTLLGWIAALVWACTNDVQ
jgi:multisubunit Na+/H+ antiporter MnhB subunit